MTLSTEQYAKALYESLQETPSKDHDTVIDNLVKILKNNNELSKFEAIIAAFEKIHNEKEGIVEATITTAGPVKIDKAMVEGLNKLAGKKVNVTHKEDDKIIGGVVVRVGDTQLDASIKTKLENLKRTLSQ